MLNYRNPHAPLFQAEYVHQQPDYTGEIRVVSWNIQYSQQVSQAIDELDRMQAERPVDVLLLQEMDEDGVDALATHLRYNYVYFPASLHSHHGRNFGNAVLSRWPMSAPIKVLLPHTSPRRQQMRTATRARLSVDDMQLLVYSAHTETFWLSSRKRSAQIETLAADINQAGSSPSSREPGHCVVAGGDFNTLTRSSLDTLIDHFEQVGLQRATEGAGPTIKSPAVRLTTDHIFTRNLQIIDRGVWRGAQASDHYPVWVDLAVNDCPCRVH